MTKLLVKHPEIRPYRLSFFDAVSAECRVRLLVNRSPSDDRFDHVVIGTTKSSIWLDIHSVRSFWREIALGDYDVLVSSTPSASATFVAIILARLRGKKVVVWTEEWRGSFVGWKGRVRQLLLWVIYKVTHAHFVTSSKTRNFLRRDFGIKESSIFFAPQCNRDLSEVMPSPPRWPIPKSSFVFLFLARVISVKGLDYLLRAFAQVRANHPSAFLLVVGDGEELARCKLLAQDLKLTNYLFHGAIPDADEALKAACFSACDVFVLPSRIAMNLYEGWGLVVGEAMSMGKPVISTDAVGCTDDLIEEGINGYVVRHSSVEGLVNAMTIMLTQRDKIATMGKASREIFEQQISYSRMSRALLDAVAFAKGVRS